MAGLRTLKLERNVARAPIWAPRAGVPVQLALAWPELPFHGESFTIDGLSGALGPGDLLVFARACTLYMARRPSDRRIEVSLGEVAEWLGAGSPGGSQLRQAEACLSRLRGANFTSHLRFGRKGSEQLIRGWSLIDDWQMPRGGRRAGSVTLSATMASLLDEDSFVRLDAGTLEQLVHADGLAARLWVFLEGESLEGNGPNGRGQAYSLFGGSAGKPAPQRQRAAIADMCRLLDPRRSETVAILRRACREVERIDSRYQLTIEMAAQRRIGMWNLRATRLKWSHVVDSRGVGVGLTQDPEPVAAAPRAAAAAATVATASSGMHVGMLEDATPASWGMVGGKLGDARPPLNAARRQGSSLAPTAAWGMDGAGPRRASSVVLSDGLFQSKPTHDRGTGSPRNQERSDHDRDDLIARDQAILDDQDASPSLREAAACHLAQLDAYEVQR